MGAGYAGPGWEWPKGRDVDYTASCCVTANRVFDCLDAATTQAEKGLAEMAAKKEAMRRLTNWPWISAILKT